MSQPRDLRDLLPYRPRGLVPATEPVPLRGGVPVLSEHAEALAKWVAQDRAFSPAFTTGRIKHAEIAAMFDVVAQLHLENSLINSDIRANKQIKAAFRDAGYRRAAQGIGANRKGKRRLEDFTLLIKCLCTVTKLMLGNRPFGAWSGNNGNDGEIPLSVVAKIRRPDSEKSWRWEIYRAGNAAAVKVSDTYFESFSAATAAGNAALAAIISEKSNSSSGAGPLVRLTFRFLSEYFPDQAGSMPARDTFDRVFKNWQSGGLSRE